MEINSLSNIQFVNPFIPANETTFSIHNTTHFEVEVKLRHSDAVYDDPAAIKTLVLQPGETASLEVPLFGQTPRFYVICTYPNGGGCGTPFEAPIDRQREFSAEIREKVINRDTYPPIADWVSAQWVIVH
jgi:hypothetical protein